MPTKAVDVDQYDLLTKDISTQIKQRRVDFIDYDFRRLPYRVASSIQADIGRIAWFDGEVFYFGSESSRDINSIEKDEFKTIERDLPNPIYRGGVSFYPVKKKKTVGGFSLEPSMLDDGYGEFFCDLLVGNLGVYRFGREIELWRRHGRLTQHIPEIEPFYGVKKSVDGVQKIALDAMDLNPFLAPMRVTSGIAINDTIYDGLGQRKMTDLDIPMQILDSGPIDLRRAASFFKLICPEEDSRHNLLLATVYPYFKINNEKFFVFRGPGGNGKGTYMEHFMPLLGEEKFGPVDIKSLAASGSFDRSNAIASLRRLLVISTPEVSLDQPKALSELKSIASGDPMVGRSIGGNVTSFRPSGVLFAETNDIVNLGVTPAMRRRMVGINFCDRLISWDEMKPYRPWVTTPEGAASIFVYAHSYFVDECAGMFEFNEIEFDAEFESNTDDSELLKALYPRVCQVGMEDAYVPCSEFATNDKRGRGAFCRRAGIVSRSKRIGRKVIRVYMCDDEDRLETLAAELFPDLVDFCLERKARAT